MLSVAGLPWSTWSCPILAASTSITKIVTAELRTFVEVIFESCMLEASCEIGPLTPLRYDRKVQRYIVTQRQQNAIAHIRVGCKLNGSISYEILNDPLSAGTRSRLNARAKRLRKLRVGRRQAGLD
uniref:(northern house mosquito) hypothetical protein n=1 Tax=Culex pipiens TaxID=7175 RepID=A0A8D8J3K9_CULPI